MRILVVEDEEKIASFVAKGLREEGYAVDVAHDGERGYLAAGHHEYDLIALDLILPKLDGIGLCRKLRQEKMAIPILMLTAKDSVKDKVVGLDSGADDYLTKPFAFEELLARVRALLRKKEAQTTKLEYGDLELDLLAHKVTRAGRGIEVTEREYRLLEYLMRNAETVVTRTMIAEHVWDVNFDTGSNVIDVYINFLRKKIDREHQGKLICTIRGRGYVLQQ